MKVIGTSKTNVEVEIDPLEILSLLYQEFMSNMPGNRIENGYWFEDIYADRVVNRKKERGKISSVNHREATDEEIEKYNAFKVLINHTKDLQ